MAADPTPMNADKPFQFIDSMQGVFIRASARRRSSAFIGGKSVTCVHRRYPR
jgi:hypothetical protein